MSTTELQHCPEEFPIRSVAVHINYSSAQVDQVRAGSTCSAQVSLKYASSMLAKLGADCGLLNGAYFLLQVYFPQLEVVGDISNAVRQAAV